MAIDTRTRLVFRSRVRTPVGYVGRSSVYDDSKWSFEGFRSIPFYSLTYILRGSCRYSEPTGREVTFGPGDVFFCFPGVPHRIDPAGPDGFAEFWISFNGPAFDLWREARILDPARFYVHVEPVDQWLDRYEGLFANARHDHFGMLALVGGLQELLAETLAQQPADSVQSVDQVWIAEAKARIDAVARFEDLDMSDISLKMRMSYSNFRRKFVTLAGMPPRRYHTSRLIETACEWMTASNLSSKEIAQRLGFCNEFHFSKRFKQFMGVSPREYRTNLPQTPSAAYAQWIKDEGETPEEQRIINMAARHLDID
ncbi:MAG: helix-turn-helix domain-containing protein [Capsulimonadaceae bacterium]